MEINTKARSRRKCEEKREPQSVQVIHQIVIPETPKGLVGEKVIFTEKYLKMMEKRDKPRLHPCPNVDILLLQKPNLQHLA